MAEDLYNDTPHGAHALCYIVQNDTFIRTEIRLYTYAVTLDRVNVGRIKTLQNDVGTRK